jgi:hypothetical protein
MKRASYRAGVAWIAEETHRCVRPGGDLFHPLDAMTDSGRVAVDLVAALFGVDPERVAGDVVRAKYWGEVKA